MTAGYDDLGRRTSLTRGNGATTSWGYDPVSRLTSLSHDLANTANDVTSAFSYNPASQIVSRSRSNGAYAWDQYVNIDHADTANGLNQLTSAGGSSLAYDGRGNLITSGSASYSYDSQNQLVSATAASTTSLLYDPLGRLREVSGGAGTRWLHDGGAPAAEYAPGTGGLLRRYVPGAGTDEVLVWYEGTGTSDRRWLAADERGSVVAVANGTGGVSINRYDDYGIPASDNTGRYQYTGQTWLPELQLYNYKARIYDPSLGRFMQTDPIGYADGMNIYAYVGNDPVNKVDPTGQFFVFKAFAAIGKLFKGKAAAKATFKFKPTQFASAGWDPELFVSALKPIKYSVSDVALGAGITGGLTAGVTLSISAPGPVVADCNAGSCPTEANVTSVAQVGDEVVITAGKLKAASSPLSVGTLAGAGTAAAIAPAYCSSGFYKAAEWADKIGLASQIVGAGSIAVGGGVGFYIFGSNLRLFSIGLRAVAGDPSVASDIAGIAVQATASLNPVAGFAIGETSSQITKAIFPEPC